MLRRVDFQVLAVQRAWQEIVRGGLGKTSLCELQELQRVAGVQRHPSGGDIQQVWKGSLGVGRAAAHLRSALHEHDAHWLPIRQAQQIDGHGGAAESGAHNNDGSR